MNNWVFFLLHNSLKSVKRRQKIAQYNSYYTTSRNSLKIQTRLCTQTMIDQSIVDLLGKLIPSVLNSIIHALCSSTYMFLNYVVSKQKQQQQKITMIFLKLYTNL